MVASNSGGRSHQVLLFLFVIGVATVVAGLAAKWVANSEEAQRRERGAAMAAVSASAAASEEVIPAPPSQAPVAPPRLPVESSNNPPSTPAPSLVAPAFVAPAPPVSPSQPPTSVSRDSGIAAGTDSSDGTSTAIARPALPARTISDEERARRIAIARQAEAQASQAARQAAAQAAEFERERARLAARDLATTRLTSDTRTKWNAAEAALRAGYEMGYLRAAEQLRDALATIAAFERTNGPDAATRQLRDITTQKLNEDVLRACITENAVNRATQLPQVPCPSQN